MPLGPIADEELAEMVGVDYSDMYEDDLESDEVYPEGDEPLSKEPNINLDEDDDFGYAQHDGSFDEDDDFGYAQHDGSFDGDDSEFEDEFEE